MGHIRRRMQRVATRTLAVVALGASACAAPINTPADANTARLAIDGQDTSTYPILCTQRNWLWTIETLPDSPGFTAMLQTGGPVRPEVIRIRDLHGFTGSSSGGAIADTEASIHGATFKINGTLNGAFADRPAVRASVRYQMEAHC